MNNPIPVIAIDGPSASGKGLARHTIKVGVMDEERRTSAMKLRFAR